MGLEVCATGRTNLLARSFLLDMKLQYPWRFYSRIRIIFFERTNSIEATHWFLENESNTVKRVIDCALYNGEIYSQHCLSRAFIDLNS